MKRLLNSLIVAFMSVVLVSCNNQQKQGTTVGFGQQTSVTSPKNDKQELIKRVVSELNQRLPLAVGYSTNLVEINLTTNTITYKYEIDDDEVGKELDNSISFMKYSSLSQIAHSLKNNIQGNNNRQFYQALVDCNYGIEIEYHELNTAKRIAYRISKSEIQDVLNGKYDDQPTPEEWE
ncbi:MAG: hypothetical protein J6Y87_08005, partial [Muribaculaceae bacterium]|nr:hypothetical protein [Muribaculaceae bacterium]